MLGCGDVIGMTPSEEALTVASESLLETYNLSLFSGVTLVVMGVAAETLDPCRAR